MHGVAQAVAQLEVDRLQFELAGLHLGEVEDVVEQSQQRVGRLQNDVEILALLVREGGLQGQLGHAHDAVHGGADFVAHVGQEIALGPVGLLGGILRNPQLVFRSAQLGGSPFQFGVGNGEFPRAGLGGGGPFSDALLQRLVQQPKFGKALRVFKGGTGNGGDELGQAFLVRAEQAAHVVVVHVEAAGWLAADEHRRAQSRANTGEQRPLLRGLALGEDDHLARGKSSFGHRAAVFRLDLPGDHREIFGGIVALEFEQQTTFPAQKPERRFAHFLEDGLARQRGGDAAAGVEHGVKAIDQREGGGLGGLGGRGLCRMRLVESEVRAE